MDIQEMGEITSFEYMRQQDGKKVSYTRPVRREERLRVQKKKRRMAARRRRRRVMRRIFISVFLMVLVGMVLAKLSGFLMGSCGNEAGGSVLSAAGSGGYGINSKYQVDTPVRLLPEDVEVRLSRLSEEYPEFQTVYDEMEAYPMNMLMALCNNPEMIDFVKGYSASEGVVTGGLTQKEKAQMIPHLLQWDKRWGYVPYGDDNIGLSGCAPVCLSMVIVGLTGEDRITPDVIGQYAMENGYYVEGTGTAWSIMTEGVSEFGIQGWELPLGESNVISELENGHPIICSVREGDFTTTGHFIVLSGVEDGKIRVQDPNSIARSEKLWDYSILEGQISNLWAFTLK